MSLLIDEIRSHPLLDGLKTPDEHSDPKFQKFYLLYQWVQSQLDCHIPVLLIQNVADYITNSGDGKGVWAIQDFPNLAPPFPGFWTEYKLRPDRTYGAFIWYREEEDAGWKLHADIFSSNTNKALAIGHVSVKVGPSGECSSLNDDGSATVNIEVWTTNETNDLSDGHKRQVVWHLGPTFLAISLLHCKNVEVVDNKIPKPLAKKWHSKYNFWPSPYKTLVIEPMKEILKREGRSEETGLKRAMHICRGHFKDYRQGAGLFGKYHQLVWQPSIVRGTVRYDLDECNPPRQMEVLVPKKGIQK